MIAKATLHRPHPGAAPLDPPRLCRVGLLDGVRRSCAAVAQSARWVLIDLDVDVAGGGISGLVSELHFLEGAPAD